jgi:serine/threonine-protein kinase
MPASTPNRPSADRNLLFGILALQAGLIRQDALISAMSAWTLVKSRPLGDILLEHGAFDRQTHALVEALVKKSLELHGDDVERSLAALSSIDSTRDQLHQLGDPDVNASLPHVSTLRDSEDPDATQGLAVGNTTSSGLRFRIVRHHAKGGLGQVSVAIDQELHREVALKEIQDQFADIPDHRSRFLREAEITGGLEHPGIVPVYGLGQYADGRPFYAMRFIKGDNLKSAIERFHRTAFSDPGQRTLELRKLLGRFLDVCNAVAYAHSRGVLHRDLKPGNIMLGPYGETLVVDWGLAKPIGQRESSNGISEGPLQPASGSDAAPTRTGQRIGTLAYMSPEQARGEWERVGPASDVYSLGATLYCLLAGQAPFVENEPDWMAKVERGQFPSPRQVNRTIPPALEAVCLKAMAFKPEDRYPSPRALADDVEHWLADEPVAAYSEFFLPRLARWGRRHRPLVAGAAALLLTAVVALAVGIVAVSREQHRTELAREDAVQNEALAFHERDAAETARKRTRAALDEMSSEVVENWLARQEKIDPAQRAFLQNALTNYKAFAAEASQTEEVRKSVAEAHLRVANLQSKLGQHAEAKETLRQAQAFFENLITDFPASAEYRQGLVASYRSLANELESTGRLKEAQSAIRAGLTVCEKLVNEFPAEQKYQKQLAASLNTLGYLQFRGRQPKDAETAFRDALAIRKRLADKFPNEAEYRSDLSGNYNNLGLLLIRMGRTEEAAVEYRNALAIQKQLMADFPEVGRYREILAVIYLNLGEASRQLKQLDDARSIYRDAITMCKQLTADFPTVPRYREVLLSVQNNLGVLLQEMDRKQEAEAAYREAATLGKQLVADFPAVERYQNLLAGVLNSLGEMVRDRKDFVEARQLLQQGLDYINTAMKAAPDQAAYRLTFCENRQLAAAVFLDLGEHAPAAEAAAELARMALKPADDTYKAACLFSRCVAVAEKDTKMPEDKRKALTKSYSERAMETLRQAVEKGYKDVANVKKDADLDPLRSRDDFKKLLAEMERKAKQ